MSAPAGKTVIELERPYALLALSGVLFLGAGLFLVHEAETNDRGLIINGILPLGPAGADVFYAILGALSLAMGALGAVSLARLMARKTFRVVLGKRAIVMPHGQLWRGADIEIPYRTIRAVGAHPAGKPSMVIIETTAGRRHLAARFLPGSWPPAAVARAILERWRASSAAADGSRERSASGAPAAGVSCEGCGRSNEGDAEFCTGCGKVLRP